MEKSNVLMLLQEERDLDLRCSLDFFLESTFDSRHLNDLFHSISGARLLLMIE